MSLETSHRKPIYPSMAREQLEALAGCRRLEPEDNPMVCANDGFRIVWDHGHWIHDSQQIAEVREIAAEGSWPHP